MLLERRHEIAEGNPRINSSDTAPQLREELGPADDHRGPNEQPTYG
jgi:hypothetical protein